MSNNQNSFCFKLYDCRCFSIKKIVNFQLNMNVDMFVCLYILYESPPYSEIINIIFFLSIHILVPGVTMLIVYSIPK